MLLSLGRVSDAVDLHRQNVALLDDIVGPRQLKTVTAREHLAQALTSAKGGSDEALALLKQCLIDRVSLQGDGVRPVAVLLAKLAVGDPLLCVHGRGRRREHHGDGGGRRLRQGC